MSETIKGSNRDVEVKPTVSRLFVLELNAGRIHTMNTGWFGPQNHRVGLPLPDGIVVDVEAGHIYWTNMGIPNLDDGSIERADIDGKNRKTIVAQGDTHTPKQIILDKKGGKLYWCDREGMRVMRCNLDGSQLETLIETGHGDTDRRDQRDGASDWRSIRNSDISTGRKKALMMPGSAASCAPISKFPPAKRQRPGPTSRSSSTTCRSRSISSSTT
jgi:sugar lactone lactonase YvrE